MLVLCYIAFHVHRRFFCCCNCFTCLDVRETVERVRTRNTTRQNRDEMKKPLCGFEIHQWTTDFLFFLVSFARDSSTVHSALR